MRAALPAAAKMKSRSLVNFMPHLPDPCPRSCNGRGRSTVINRFGSAADDRRHMPDCWFHPSVRPTSSASALARRGCRIMPPEGAEGAAGGGGAGGGGAGEDFCRRPSSHLIARLISLLGVGRRARLSLTVTSNSVQA